MRSIPIGAKGSFEAVVRREDLAGTFKDASLPPVLSTPVMISAPTAPRTRLSVSTIRGSTVRVILPATGPSVNATAVNRSSRNPAPMAE